MSILAILLAALAAMVLGAIWYSPLLFGPAWLTAINKDQDELKPLWPMLGSVLACLASSFSTAYLFLWLAVSTWFEALFAASLISLVVFAAMLSDNLFCGWGIKLFLIQIGYRLAYIYLMAAIIFSFS